MAAVQQNITYLRELRAGDIIVVRSRLLEMREKVIRLQHEMTDAETGEPVAKTEMTGVHLDRDTRRACAFPEALRTSAQKHIRD